MMRERLLRLGLPAAAAFALSACGDAGIEDVKHWMTDIKQQTKVAVPKLSEPKKFQPFSYTAKDSLDPFNSDKLAVALAKTKSNSNSTLKPDTDRRREALEYFPLDQLKMVGTLHKAGLSYALLQVDRSVYHVKVGNYVGQNFGMITNITETEVEIKEIVQDAAGEWIERQAKLELQETSKQQGTAKK